MTKHVTFITHEPGIAIGDRRLVPDHVAELLEREGKIEANPPDFPPRERAPVPDARGKRRQSYLTKGA